MQVSYLKSWVLLSPNGALLQPGVEQVQLNDAQQEVLGRVIQGRCPLSSSVLRFLRGIESVGVAELGLRDRSAEAIIVDRGWGGVFQHAVDVWEQLNRRYRTLLIAPRDPPYGFDVALSPLLVTPGRLGVRDTSYTVFVTIMRSILRAVQSRIVLCTHRALAPFLFDIALERRVIFHGDAFFESRSRLGRFFAGADDRKHDPSSLLQELLLTEGAPETPGCAEATWRAYSAAVQIWSWTMRQLHDQLESMPETTSRSSLVYPIVECASGEMKRGDAHPNVVLFTTTANNALDRKGLAALKTASRALPNMKIRLVLDSPPPSAALHGFGDNLEVLTHVSRDTMRSLYHEALVNCRVSEHDSTPVSIIESMARGVPVIVSPIIAGNLPFILDGVNGFVVSPGDGELLAQRLRTLAQDPDLRRAMGARAREAIKIQSGDGLLTRLDDLIGEPHSRAS